MEKFFPSELITPSNSRFHGRDTSANASGLEWQALLYNAAADAMRTSRAQANKPRRGLRFC
jgi:hypothetical protein